MHRRRVLAGMAALLLPAGCAAPRPQDPAPPSPPPPSEYAWFPAGSGLVKVYTLTWVEALSPDAVASRAGARRLGTRRWPAGGWKTLPGTRANETVVAVTRAHGWALMVEDSANAIGAADNTIGKLSKGTRLVTFSHNYQAADRFVLASDGTILVDFDPGYPPDRVGTEPDLLVGDMRAVGLNTSAVDAALAQPEPAMLALTERVTGVPLTRHLLRDSAYLAAAVTVRSSDDSQQ
ncbi:DUF6461 domain-containing protein [Actinoplanes sp. NPDC051411]|uniref:DUF6461 domain-containing protein n=1 Tax=Actinoplanes sp. NPDC051411 TaxID=3155522 RepID=UPI003418E17B